jgi:2-succinyl-5-enolpyruvyl-6-hydroxy-3-cyclohexene-1-carboxylate synthase
MKKTTPANLNYAWAELMVRELERLGVNTFFIAPGSRSSPLTLSAAELAAHVVLHVDERGVGFAALGYARATGRPAVVITTSGSATANLWPAICEAAMDHVPMIVLTADRPPELRDTGANQTMDQVKLFDGYVRWQVDMACPDVRIPAPFVLSTVDEAVSRATQVNPGPVHINQMFREPLAPEKARDGASAWMKSLGGWWTSTKPWTHHEPVKLTGGIDEATKVITSAKRGLIVAGALQNRHEADAVIDIAEKLGWPVLPDIRSGLRLSAKHDQVIEMADQLLLSPKVEKIGKPDVVLHVGGRITSKRLLHFLASSRPSVTAAESVSGSHRPGPIGVASRGDVARRFCRTHHRVARSVAQPGVERTLAKSESRHRNRMGTGVAEAGHTDRTGCGGAGVGIDGIRSWLGFGEQHAHPRHGNVRHRHVAVDRSGVQSWREWHRWQSRLGGWICPWTATTGYAGHRRPRFVA